MRAKDGQHLDTAGRGAYQGVTREHFVEAGAARGRAAPRAALPRGPGLDPPDRQLRQRRARAGLAGSATRGLVALGGRRGGALPRGAQRPRLPGGEGQDDPPRSRRAASGAAGPGALRLSTNLEIYWDRLGWAVGRPDVKLDARRLPLRTAELRPRGYSVTDQSSPSVSRAPALRAGRHHAPLARPRGLPHALRRREGAAAPGRRPLRHHERGRRAALPFPGADPPAPGQRRDFVVVGDGWVKDGDYNTTFSRTVLPLPTHATGRYDRRADATRGRSGLPAAPRRLRGVPHALRLSGARAGARCIACARGSRREALRPARSGRRVPGPARDARADAPAAAARRGRLRRRRRRARALRLPAHGVGEGRGPRLRPRGPDAGRQARAHHAAGHRDGRCGLDRRLRPRRLGRSLRHEQPRGFEEPPVPQPRRRELRGRRRRSWASPT